MSEFVTGGAVPPQSPAYVHRAFEDEAFGHLTSAQADWVLLLGPRQHGKSSGLARLAQRLQDQGFRVAAIDLQAYGADAGYERLLEWLGGEIATAVGNPRPTVEERQRESLDAWLGGALEGVNGSVAVFVDEAAALPDAVRRRLYAQLRALYNARGQAGQPSALARLVFVFAGTFRVDRLIDTDNSPFNVSKDVEPEDLTSDDALRLAGVGADDLTDVVRAAFELVGGQPYLLQVLLAAAGDSAGRNQRFDEAVGRLRDGTDRHVVALFDRVLGDEDATRVVGAMLDAGGEIDLNPINPTHQWLQVLGLAGRRGGRLIFRNRLYAELAHSARVPGAGQPSAPIVDPSPANLDEKLFDAIGDTTLRGLALDAALGAVAAHDGGHHRLALIAFGSALEAVLLAHLEALDPDALTAARNAVKQPPKCPPARWGLAQLAEVAHETPTLTGSSFHLTDTVRGWRNFVHPDRARHTPQSNAELADEAGIAALTLRIVLRELGR